MLIQLAGRFVVDPSQYPRRLVVELEVGDDLGNHPGCGVFSGQHDGFENPVDMNRWLEELPIGGKVPWARRYEIRTPNRPKSDLRRGYHYVAVGWHDGVYAKYPVPTEILVEDSAGSWSVSISRGDRITVMMPDYSPWDITS